VRECGGGVIEEDGREGGWEEVAQRARGTASLAKTKLPAPAVQQQEGARGTVPHDGSGDISCLVNRTVALLPDLLFGICLRWPLLDEYRCRANDRARPQKGEATREGVGLRWPPD